MERDSGQYSPTSWRDALLLFYENDEIIIIHIIYLISIHLGVFRFYVVNVRLWSRGRVYFSRNSRWAVKTTGHRDGELISSLPKNLRRFPEDDEGDRGHCVFITGHLAVTLLIINTLTAPSRSHSNSSHPKRCFHRSFHWKHQTTTSVNLQPSSVQIPIVNVSRGRRLAGDKKREERGMNYILGCRTINLIMVVVQGVWF